MPKAVKPAKAEKAEKEVPEEVRGVVLEVLGIINATGKPAEDPRVVKLAKKLEIDPKELVEKLKELNVAETALRMGVEEYLSGALEQARKNGAIKFAGEPSEMTRKTLDLLRRENILTEDMFALSPELNFAS